MDIKKLQETYPILLEYMNSNDYSKHYIRLLRTEINWILNNYESKEISSYEQACSIRSEQTFSYDLKRRYRLFYGLLKRFEEDSIFPNRRRQEPLVKRGSYHLLCPEFKEVIDIYCAADEARGLKEHTIYGNASGGSCFLLKMQNLGHTSLSTITEEDTLSFFVGDDGKAWTSSCYKKEISAVFKADLGDYSKEAHRIHAYMPKIRPKRKTIPYLQPEEIEAIHEIIQPECSALSLRNKAIATLLFFTGLRGCDIATLEFNDIDWNSEEIVLTQEKTGINLNLPLTPTIGNAIYDYISNEIPISSDTHIFLSEQKPYDPLKPKALYYIAGKIYDAANIRMNSGDRRGTHLFRYNLATSFVGKGIARPVISETLGHADPNSLDYYLFSDVIHLRECALSIERYPVCQEVFE